MLRDLVSIIITYVSHFLIFLQVASKQWNSNEISVNDDLTKLCNHKRKIIAMATFHKTALQRDRGIAASLLTDSSGEAANTDDPKSQPSGRFPCQCIGLGVIYTVFSFFRSSRFSPSRTYSVVISYMNINIRDKCYGSNDSNIEMRTFKLYN